MKCNGWIIKYTKIFNTILCQLEDDVLLLKKADPENYHHHEKTKLLKKVLLAIKTEVPENPRHSKFFLGQSLGPYPNWRRVKHGLPDRYRMFFKFWSQNSEIVFAWLNDEKTLRKAGSKTDAYRVFRKMLQAGKVEDEFLTLVQEAVDPPMPKEKSGVAG